MKNNSPLISIIVPVYNTDLRYLEKCLDSIKLQDYQNTEVIIVDDGSGNETNQFLKRYIDSVNNLQWNLIRQKNQGLSAARNTGYRQAKGKYIQFLDADDYFDNRLVSTAVAIAERDHADIVVHNFEVYNMRSGKKVIVYSDSVLPKERPFKLEDLENKVGAIAYNVWSKMFKKDFLDNIHLLHEADLHRAEDVLFTYTALVQAKRISFLPENYIVYREDLPGSNTSTNDKYPTDSIKSWNALYDLIQEKDLYGIYRSDFENAMVGSLYWHLERLHTDEVKIAFGQAARKLFKKIDLSPKNDHVMAIELSSIRPDLVPLVSSKNGELETLRHQLNEATRQLEFSRRHTFKRNTKKLASKVKSKVKSLIREQGEVE